MHLESGDFPAYAHRLGEVIEEISPDVIAAELFPEQLAGTQPCDSKPEQRDVNMPTAGRLAIPIIPVQPSTEQVTEWERRFKAVDQQLRSQQPGRHYLDYSERLA
jgi:hypothetical protein